MFAMLRLVRRAAKSAAAALAVVGALTVAPAAQPPEADVEQPPAPEAAQAIERVAQRTLQVLRNPSLDTRARRDRLAEVLRGGLDIPTIADFVMGRHADRLSAEQRGRFRAAFGDYVVQTYARMLARQSIADIEVAESRKVTPSTAAVSTRVLRSAAENANWTWRLHRRDGAYRIVDLQTSGVSLAVTYRSEFGAELARGRMDRVIDQLREQTAGSGDLAFERLALIQLLRDFSAGALALNANGH